MNETFTQSHSDEYLYEDEPDTEFQDWFQGLLSKRLEENHPAIYDVLKEDV